MFQNRFCLKCDSEYNKPMEKILANKGSPEIAKSVFWSEDPFCKKRFWRRMEVVEKIVKIEVQNQPFVCGVAWISLNFGWLKCCTEAWHGELERKEPALT